MDRNKRRSLKIIIKTNYSQLFLSGDSATTNRTQGNLPWAGAKEYCAKIVKIGRRGKETLMLCRRTD